MPRATPRTRKRRSAASRQKPRSNRRVQKHRDKLRAMGLKPVQIWVPDPNDPAFVAEVRRQCLLLKDDPQEEQILEEMLSVADFSGWKG